MSAVTKQEALAGAAHQSRWGYHPCSYETFAELKLLKKYHWRWIYAQAAWERWDRKHPDNRVIRQRVRNDEGQVIGYNTSPRPEPKVGPYISEKVLADFDRARFPTDSPEDVDPLRLSLVEIDALVEKVRAHYGI